MASKEFLEWKEKIEGGNVAILSIGTTEEYVGGMQSKLIMEYGVDVSEEFAWDDEDQHEPLSEYVIEFVKVENKRGMLITMGVTKDLAEEFKNYLTELRKHDALHKSEVEE